MAQFLRPNGDITVNAFTGTPINTAGNRYQNIDEAAASDTDFNWGANNTAAIYECALQAGSDPNLSTGHVIRFRLAKTNNGFADGAGSVVKVTYSLLQGGLVIKDNIGNELVVTGTWTQHEFALSGVEADAITNYADLRLRFVTSASGGSPANRRGGAVSWAEMELPDSAAEVKDGKFFQVF